MGFLFYHFNGPYNTCAKHTEVNRQASVAKNSVAGFFLEFFPLLTKISEYNKKLSSKPNA